MYAVYALTLCYTNTYIKRTYKRLRPVRSVSPDHCFKHSHTHARTHPLTHLYTRSVTAAEGPEPHRCTIPLVDRICCTLVSGEYRNAVSESSKTTTTGFNFNPLTVTALMSQFSCPPSFPPMSHLCVQIRRLFCKNCVLKKVQQHYAGENLNHFTLFV